VKSSGSFLAVLVAVLALGGCGGGGGGNDEIRFLVFGEPEEIKAYRTLISAYEERDDSGPVQLIEASDREDLLARLSTSFAGGSPPDLFLVNYRFYGQFAARGVLEPLQERVEESDQFEPDDFFPEAMEAFHWGGVLTCLPQNVSSLVVYYNRDLFERFGVAEPKAGMRWTEFIIKAVNLTRDAQGKPVSAGDPELGAVRPAIFGLGIEPTVIRLAPFVWSNGGELFDDPEHPTRFALEEPRALVALQEFLKLRTDYGVVPSDQDVEAEDDESRFANGRLAMLLSSRRSTPTFRTIKDFDWDVAPLPVFEQPAGILHSDAYCMSKASEAKDEAWRFVEFANSPEGQRIVAETGRTVPSLKSVANSDAFLDPAAKPNSSHVFLDGIPTIRRVPTISTWPEIEDAAEGILENGLYLGQDPQRVARELDRVTRPLFARAERPDTASR
jgi:multiple sugar transport system substrate-binding protein